MSAAHDAHADHGGHGDHGHHESHASHYVRIWAILCVLLVISILGPMAEIMLVTLVTAFGIAAVKAYMVMKHFMHLDVERPVVWYILTTSVVFIVMFFAAVSVDVMNHDGARWSNVAAKEAIMRGLEAGDTTAHHGGGHEGGAAAGHEAAAEGHGGH